MRKSGILLHISSLPSRYGIGSLGEEAYRFVDFLAAAGQACWQILPLGPTSYGDSPYQSFSTFAGNPYFIDLDTLAGQGLLQPHEYQNLDWGVDAARVDYATLYRTRFAALRLAFSRFDVNLPAYRYFCEAQAAWLHDFALFMAIKAAHGDRSWHEWAPEYRLRDAAAISHFEAEQEDAVSFWKFVQYQFFDQWWKLKQYTNAHGIQIIGDLPIYVADDSADVWGNPELFDLDDERQPISVAGVPPDAFTAEGQLWGNPVYNWGAMRAQDYRWWVERMRMASSLCDIVRIDHFRGFESYYTLSADAVNAVQGTWKEGPGFELFQVLRERLGEIDIIAENLGFLTPSVRILHRETGYPGMNLLQFAFGADDLHNENLPHNIGVNTIAYAGTHDNNTILGWLASMSERDRQYCLDYMGLDSTDQFDRKFIRMLLGTRAGLSIITMQDLLALGEEARMNTPSTLGGNWEWRALPGMFTPELAKELRHLTKLYGRDPDWQ